MAIESSGAISLGTTAGTNRSISAEFGGTQPHSLSEYYRDGSYSDGISIPSGETSIPASGAISFSDFYGTSAVVIELGATQSATGQVALAGGGVQFIGTPPSTYEVGHYSNSVVSIDFSTTWITGGDPGDYEAKVSIISGSTTATLNGGLALNTYYTLNTTRQWFWTHSSTGQLDIFTIEVTVRDTATQTVQDSTQVDITIDTI